MDGFCNQNADQLEIAVVYYKRNGTFFGMSESLEASTRRWSSNHVPHDSTYKPKKNINNIELIKEEEQQPLRSIEPREPIRS
jgi:hypothetical protein